VIARRVNAERILLLGWSRAILLQLAHPLVAAGVADHSQIRAGAAAAAARLRSTVRSMQSLVYGDEAAWTKSIAMIRAIHRRVHGELRMDVGPFPAGTPYSAEDPALLLWVHVTFIDSALLMFDTLVAPLTDEEKDQYCSEAVTTAVALGATDEDVPRTWSALRAYMAREYASGRITVGRDAQAIGEAVLFPPLSVVTGPAAWVNRLVTIGLLPEPIRAQYGYLWSDRRARQLDRVIRLLRTARRASPRPVAWWSVARASS
jgi:uncharacterized protein (DUF2236 family)